jgi:hypothetical protein
MGCACAVFSPWLFVFLPGTPVPGSTWTGALWTLYYQRAFVAVESGHWYVSGWRTPWAASFSQTPPEATSTGSVGPVPKAMLEFVALPELPSWSRGSAGPPTAVERDRRVTMTDVAIGFPLVALASRQTYSPVDQSTTTNGLRFTNSANYWARRATSTAFPLTPIWHGLFVNSLFFASMIYALRWLAARAQERRKSRRARTGYCPNCKYPIGQTSVCPECGWTNVYAAKSP